MSKYTTGEIAKLCGVSVRTVQYYDERGILIPSELSEGGRRLYSEDDYKKLKIICFLRDAGIYNKQRANAKGVPFHTTNETPFANPPRIQQTSYCAALLRLIASAGKSPMPVTGEISARQRNHRHGHANHVKQPIDGM